VRDRLGVKPLYYAQVSDGSVIFGSELKVLLAHPLLRREPSLTAIEDYLALGYVPDDACIVAGVRKLGAGMHLKLVRGRGLPEPQTYWDVSFADRSKAKAPELIEELTALMRDAVKLRMISDVPLGAFLSGGVDSSSVVAMMAENSRAAVKTCTIGFDVESLDERAYADRVARRFATDHRTRIVSPDDYGLLDTLVTHFDEPFADASALPTYRVCELARDEVTVALSGDGADEAFAGYRRHLFQHRGERARSLMPAAIRQPLFSALGRIYPKMDWAPRFLRAKSTFQELAVSGGEAYARSVGFTPPELRARLYTHSFTQKIDGHRAEDRIITAMENAPARDAIDRAQYADLKIWLPGDILTKTDRMSMAVSLEAREPLLDYRLVEFAAKLPVGQRIHGKSGKYLMKRAMEPHLPHDILYRDKMGFVTPISQWFRDALAGEAAAVASGSTLARTGWLDPKAMRKLAADHKAGRADHGRLLWQLLVLDKSLARLFA
jgi:asparagine synthase (glutamine-hydrolysing)